MSYLAWFWLFPSNNSFFQPPLSTFSNYRRTFLLILNLLINPVNKSSTFSTSLTLTKVLNIHLLIQLPYQQQL